MKISIIIPAYNVENYIERCISSILVQNIYEIEIIVVNDGSTDNTLEKLLKIKDKDNRIKILNQANKGSIEARKLGLKKANGKYIMFVDADDWIEKDSLEKVYNNAIQNNSDIVLFNYYTSYDDRKIENIIYKKNKIDNEDLIRLLLLEKIEPTLWSMFIKREFIIKENIKFPNNISMSEDISTLLSMFITKPMFSIETSLVYNYYQRKESITNTLNDKVLDIGIAMNFMKKLLMESDLYLNYKDEIEYIIYKDLFVYSLIKYNGKLSVHRKIKKSWDSHNIRLYDNKYIMNDINKYNENYKFRIRMYNSSVLLGRALDWCITIKNNIIKV